MIKSYLGRIRSLRRPTPDALIAEIEQPLVDRIPYRPGQYITLKVLLGGQTHYRSYSLWSVPGQDRFLGICIKRTPGGLISNYLCDSLEAGQEIEFLRPRGQFLLDTSLKNRRRILLIAAGSGIAPIYALLRALLYFEPESQADLVYANRRPEDILFREELDWLAAHFRGRFRLFHFLSQGSDAALPGAFAGRLSAERLASLPELFGQEPKPERAYLCGPEGFMDAAAQGLQGAGMPPEALHRESFEPAPADLSLAQQDGETRTVRIRLGAALHQVKVPPGMTLLEAGLRAGLPLPYACKRGVCASCLARSLGGQTLLANDWALLDFERKAGKLLLCQTYPASDDVEVQVGE